MIFLPHTNTVILLEPYCGTITEPGLPVVPPPKLVSREQKFGNIGEMAGLDHRCSQGSLSSSKREDHGNDVRCGRLTTELTMATRPRAQVNDLRMLYWLLKTATGSRFQTARPEK